MLLSNSTEMTSSNSCCSVQGCVLIGAQRTGQKEDKCKRESSELEESGATAVSSSSGVCLTNCSWVFNWAGEMPPLNIAIIRAGFLQGSLG